MSDAYREEIRKLRALPSDLPAPALLWTVDDDIADVRWVILCFKYIDGRLRVDPGSWTNCA